MESRNARIGLRLFLLYSLFYAAFVLMNAFAPTVMEATPVAGLNLALLSGFGLIFLAFVIALLYGFLASNVTKEKNGNDTKGQS